MALAIVVGAFCWSFDADKMDAKAEAYYKDHQAQAKAFGIAMDKLKSMNAEQAGGVSADFFADLFGSLSLKGLKLLAKGASWATLEGVDNFAKAVETEMEFAKANGIASATGETLKTIPVVTNIAMQDGSEVAKNVGWILAQNPSILEETGADLANIAQDIVKIEKKISEQNIIFKLLKEAIPGPGKKAAAFQFYKDIGEGIDKIRILFRRDFYPRSHGLGDHFNVEIHRCIKKIGLKEDFKKVYDYHILVDDKLNVTKTFWT